MADRQRGICAHCNRERTIHARGLCEPCHSDTKIREKFPLLPPGPKRFDKRVTNHSDFALPPRYQPAVNRLIEANQERAGSKNPAPLVHDLLAFEVPDEAAKREQLIAALSKLPPPDRLGFLRKRRRLSLRALERKVCVPYSSLNRYENGKRELSLDAFKRLSAFFEVPIDALVN